MLEYLCVASYQASSKQGQGAGASSQKVNKTIITGGDQAAGKDAASKEAASKEANVQNQAQKRKPEENKPPQPDLSEPENQEEQVAPDGKRRKSDKPEGQGQEMQQMTKTANAVRALKAKATSHAEMLRQNIGSDDAWVWARNEANGGQLDKLLANVTSFLHAHPFVSKFLINDTKGLKKTFSNDFEWVSSLKEVVALKKHLDALENFAKSLGAMHRIRKGNS